MTINIEWQDQHGNWHHYQTKQNWADAYRCLVSMKKIKM